MLRKYVFIVFFVGLSMTLVAESLQIIELDEEMKPVMTASYTLDQQNVCLEDVVKLALQNNRAIKTSEFNIKKASGQVDQARSIGGLKFSANMTQTRIKDVPSANLGGQTVEMGRKDIQKIWGEFAQPLYLGERDRAAVNSARLGQLIAESAHTLTRQQIIMAASLSYYSWLYAREVEDVGKMDQELAQAHFDLVGKRYEAEQTSKYEVLRAEVRLAQNRSAYIKAGNDTGLSRLSMLKLLSLPLDIAVDTACRLEVEEIAPQLEEDIVMSEELREDLQIKKRECRIADEQIRAARGEKKLTAALFAQYGTENPSSYADMGQVERKSYWLAGLSLNLPIMDAGFSRGKVNEARAARSQNENEYFDAVEQAHLEIRQAYLTLKSSEEIVAAQKENLKQAEETMRLANVRYENGLFTQVDLFDAETAYSNTRLQYLQAVFFHHQARLAYLLATGKLGRDRLS
ncbi:MAG: hypothetical protein CVV42_06750 [Candidatus Riflebacteria bacterium HGW-Riflebacteria-2]|jgi:outer membrane protein TolC|nr:MAG: hypothetical protein CVV42_06750 [Candidatus Riflebacteria bacterium HGW-Riflebacteria-2]